MISLTYVIALSGILFAIAVAGVFLNRRNVIVLLMCIELMLLAVNFNFVAFSRFLGDIAGQIFVFFILTVAAAEAAIGLAILVVRVPRAAQHRRRRSRLATGLTGNLRVRGSRDHGVDLPHDRARAAGGGSGGGPVRTPDRQSRRAQRLPFAGVALSCGLSVYVLYQLVFEGMAPFDGPVYTWLLSDGLNIQVGFLIDRLSALMMSVVTFVSLMVHIYTIGYMADDDGYQRFFSYISLFTFSMLMLVMSNNFMQLFFGWEGVGVVSYLLIGFWYTRPTATFAALKAFIVNRVGDFGFLFGIAAILRYTGSLNYGVVFAHAEALVHGQIQITHAIAWPAITFACICLFVGAMGKSAQVPLHIWLPDSMEGPTPISALIHAATMVTAGIFMVARMSPLFEQSDTALSFVLIIGATTAFFMGLVGVVNNDIKRVIAYSTLSQLGYMTVALGASAYGAGIFHLMTHAFFKALLFLAAGSVIMAMHHEQDMRKMGGLRKYLPITYWTFLIGSLALIGFPGTSGFFSKDLLIDAVHDSHRAGAQYAYYCMLGGVFVTALYTFRAFFMTFHGKERMDEETRHHLHESPWVVTVPLILLAIPSLISRLAYRAAHLVRRLLPGCDSRAAGGRCAQGARRGIPRSRRRPRLDVHLTGDLLRRRRCARGVPVLSEVPRLGGRGRAPLQVAAYDFDQQVRVRLVQ